ncbi:hypothetical protein Hanom_Chr14g01308481 [Helianthus anomalus]
MLKSINLLNPRKAQKRSSRSSLLLLHSFQQVSPATEIAGFRPEQQKQKRSRSSLLLHSFQQVSGRNCRFPAGSRRRNPLFSRYSALYSI